jgi:antitoxin component YwqK of YwqJK toxin-antitoxin module
MKKTLLLALLLTVFYCKNNKNDSIKYFYPTGELSAEVFLKADSTYKKIEYYKNGNVTQVSHLFKALKIRKKYF